MSGDYSSDGLLSFLRDATVAGLMHPATARSRRKAAQALFAYLNEGERADLRNLNLEQLAARIHDAPQDDLRGELVGLYSQRLSGALEDYFTFAESQGSATVAAPSSSAPQSSSDAQPAEARALESVRLSFNSYRADVIPVPLGTGRVVYIHGMPADLSAAEAEKIARVVQAFASEDDAES